MTLFEYLGVLISVVMGLGVTHLLTGLSKIIRERDTIHVYWVHLLWTFNILLYLMAVWWGMFWWSDLAQWSFLHFLFISLYATTLFLLGSMLFPRFISPDHDFREYFLENRSWFFGIQLAAWLIDIPETVLKAAAGLRPLPDHYEWFIGIMIAISLAGLVFKSPKVHAVLPVVWAVVMLSFISLSTLGTIANPF